MNELAKELNSVLDGTVVSSFLSPVGRRMYFPKGIVAQSAEAGEKAKNYNATVGLATKNGQPMHFSDIAREVKSQNFHRNNVTEQAIHNELIKDDRFVLIGRGIYALAENGYKKGSITDVITELLKEHGPMYRDDIVREVLKMRQVRETTILLNLQSKPQFKRVAKNQYALADQA